MALPYNYYVGNGSTSAYSFTQELNDQATVVGLVNYVSQTGTWDLGTLTFSFDVAPASGDDVHVLRQTNNNIMVATYPNKSYISSENLDADFRQLLMLTQETEFLLEQLNFMSGSIEEYVAQQVINTADIAANAAQILINDTNIINLDARVGTNETNIGNNTTNIGTNASGLAQEILDRIDDVDVEESARIAADAVVASNAEDLSIAYAIALGG